ncbi:hypothetical protein [Litoribrevibacter albus]|uniref:Uncharacterized protein n=1 Tax=Litoribrevibacter albus TaxID=1473156 RepID=A0AA37S9I8_9GAMM|nr:hypothetical protein [Litoribrevibacter albus]GLQ31650.1 hypothetical protein GCM10007876_21290 [Litoribrevibacter albus]
MKLTALIIAIWAALASTMVFAASPEEVANTLDAVLGLLSAAAYLLPAPVQGAIFIGTSVIALVTHGVKHIPQDTRKKLLGKADPVVMAIAGNTKHCANGGSVPEQVAERLDEKVQVIASALNDSIQTTSQRVIRSELDKQSADITGTITNFAHKLTQRTDDRHRTK